MAKEKNLIPQNKRTKSEQRAIAAKGGKASGESRRQAKALRDCLKAILGKDVADDEIKALLEKNGVAATYDNAMSLAIINKALSGDPKAFEVVRDTIGEKPQDKLQLSGEVQIDDARARLIEKLNKDG